MILETEESVPVQDSGGGGGGERERERERERGREGEREGEREERLRDWKRLHAGVSFYSMNLEE